MSFLRLSIFAMLAIVIVDKIGANNFLFYVAGLSFALFLELVFIMVGGDDE